MSLFARNASRALWSATRISHGPVQLPAIRSSFASIVSNPHCPPNTHPAHSLRHTLPLTPSSLTLAASLRSVRSAHRRLLQGSLQRGHQQVAGPDRAGCGRDHQVRAQAGLTRCSRRTRVRTIHSRSEASPTTSSNCSPSTVTIHCDSISHRIALHCTPSTFQLPLNPL